ncbi:MAG: hypothetical protein KGI70_02665 [Patescibacteria group bacterium]|nr:hypothetical protein [Patescibacteria group bacterium]
MEHIGKRMEREKDKDKRTERGELMRFFMQKLNRTRARDGLPALTMARMGRVLIAIPTRDLYYLKSICEDAERRSDKGWDAFSKKFWWEVNPKKHQKE